MTFSAPGVEGLKNLVKFSATLLPAAAGSLGPDPLTVGTTPVAHGAAAAVPPAGALTLGLAVAAGLVLDALGLELLQAAATSIRPATTPVSSTGCRRSLAWFGSMVSTT
jgi:hypothetical protein